MRRTKIPIQTYKPNSNESLIFDTNILIKLFYPIDFSGSADNYTNLYDEIKKVKANLIISAIQISEFVNRCIRLQFDLYRKNLPDPNIDFKRDYRSTNDYYNNMSAILDIIKCDILPNFTFVNDEFNLMQHDNIFRYGFSYDFTISYNVHC